MALVLWSSTAHSWFYSGSVAVWGWDLALQLWRMLTLWLFNLTLKWAVSAGRHAPPLCCCFLSLPAYFVCSGCSLMSGGGLLGGIDWAESWGFFKSGSGLHFSSMLSCTTVSCEEIKVLGKAIINHFSGSPHMPSK